MEVQLPASPGFIAKPSVTKTLPALFNQGMVMLRDEVVEVHEQTGFRVHTVDNSLVPGIGHRLDGWANRDLNVG
jgi:hypothetical protein